LELVLQKCRRHIGRRVGQLPTFFVLHRWLAGVPEMPLHQTSCIFSHVEALVLWLDAFPYANLLGFDRIKNEFFSLKSLLILIIIIMIHSHIQIDIKQSNFSYRYIM